MKKKIKNNFFTKKHNLYLFYIISTIILVIFLIFSTVRIEKRKIVLNKRIEELKNETSNIEKENAALKKAEEEGKSSYYIEKLLREKGLYKKKGEYVAVILMPSEKSPSNSE